MLSIGYLLSVVRIVWQRVKKTSYKLLQLSEGSKVFNTIFNSILALSRWKEYLSMLSWSSFYQQYAKISFQANILSKPLAAFPCNYYWNDGQLSERNESCCNDYHQSSERILAESGIKPPFSSPACHRLSLGEWGLIRWGLSTTLTHSHTMTPFDAPGKQAFWKHCGKRRNCS